MFDAFLSFVRELYCEEKQVVPLHAPRFNGNERDYVLDTIDSTFVSSVGKYVDIFEQAVAEYTGSKYCIAVVNGTAALHIALMLAGVEPGDEVLVPSLTFVATCNAIRYCQAEPVFFDIELESLGICPENLRQYLETNIKIKKGFAWNTISGKRIKACLPMHNLGHPAKVAEIRAICDEFNISVLEDAAESLGSFRHGKHTGLVGDVSAISFNGNKIITTGGGGMILTSDACLAEKAKHLSTTGKVSHHWEYSYDCVGYNYRMPNLNAALGLAQLEQLDAYLQSKRKVARKYQDWFRQYGYQMVAEPADSQSNYWLNAVYTKNAEEKEAFLAFTNENGVQTRPIWQPMHLQKIYQDCLRASDFANTELVRSRLVLLPSSVLSQ